MVAMVSRACSLKAASAAPPVRLFSRTYRATSSCLESVNSVNPRTSAKSTVTSHWVPSRERLSASSSTLATLGDTIVASTPLTRRRSACSNTTRPTGHVVADLRLRTHQGQFAVPKVRQNIGAQQAQPVFQQQVLNRFLGQARVFRRQRPVNIKVAPRIHGDHPLDTPCASQCDRATIEINVRLF